MATRIDKFIIQVFQKIPFLHLDAKYLTHYRFRKFIRYTLIMAVGYGMNVPLIWLFQDYFKIHWFFSVGAAALIVHVIKFFSNDRWTWSGDEY